MRTHKNKTQSTANVAPQKSSNGKPIFQFVDNRPEATSQKKLQKLANNNIKNEPFTKSSKSNVIQRVATTDIKKSNALFGINKKLDANYKSYVDKVDAITPATEKDSYATGLLNWAVHYHKEAAGSDAELRRVLYHEEAFDKGRGNEMRLGRNNTTESDLVGKVNKKERSEEVKAVTTSDPSTVESQINNALSQLEDVRALSKTERKVVIYIYNDRNPWPFNSIQAAKGKKKARIVAQAISRLKSKHQRVKGGIHIVVNDINMFKSNKTNAGTTFVEMTWPNADEKVPAKRRVGVDAQVGVSSPFRGSHV